MHTFVKALAMVSRKRWLVHLSFLYNSCLSSLYITLFQPPVTASYSPRLHLLPFTGLFLHAAFILLCCLASFTAVLRNVITPVTYPSFILLIDPKTWEVTLFCGWSKESVKMEASTVTTSSHEVEVVSLGFCNDYTFLV